MRDASGKITKKRDEKERNERNDRRNRKNGSTCITWFGLYLGCLAGVPVQVCF